MRVQRRESGKATSGIPGATITSSSSPRRAACRTTGWLVEQREHFLLRGRGRSGVRRGEPRQIGE
jgi:hypothetical protein